MQNEVNAGQQTQVRKSKVKVLGDLEKEEDILRAVVNLMGVNRAFVDVSAMEAGGRPCILQTILSSVLEWVQKVLRDLPSWRQATGDQMPHIRYVLYNIIEAMLIKFAEFNNDLGNLTCSKTASFGDINVSAIKDMLQIFKRAQDTLANHVAMHTPWTAVPSCAPHLPGHNLVQQQRTAPAITPVSSPTDANGDSPEQRSAKKARVESPPKGRVPANRTARLDPKTRGWFTPADGKHPCDAFPANLDICPFFASMGFACENANCTKKHVANIRAINRNVAIRFLDGLLDSKAGWVSKTQAGTLYGRKYEAVLGPPDNQTAGA
jgi:hypothetical protein